MSLSWRTVRDHLVITLVGVAVVHVATVQLAKAGALKVDSVGRVRLA